MKTINKILMRIKNNKEEFEKELKGLKTDLEWQKFLDKWFKVSIWQKRNYLEVDKELKKRKPFKKAGFKWYPFSQPYKIPKKLAYEYEHILDLKLEKLEPNRFADLYTRKEGRGCEYCSIFVKSIKPKKCPICGRRLFYFRITED